jgi:hypothetical protein
MDGVVVALIVIGIILVGWDLFLAGVGAIGRAWRGER